MVNNINLNFYEEEPLLDFSGNLEIQPLAPLSMVSSQPGSYFRSELAPTTDMLLGLCENALGWHFHNDLRKILLKSLTKQVQKSHKKNKELKDHPWFSGKPKRSGSGYFSFLQHHLIFSEVTLPENLLTYDDLWSMSNRANSINFVGGSRNYDSRLEGIINLSKLEKIAFGDRKEFETYTLEELRNLKEGKVKVGAINPFFPMYYSSPRKRGYVESETPYKVSFKCTRTVAKLLEKALYSPAAPLYLGNSEGWVYVKWIKND